MVLTSSPARKREERNLHSECRRRGQKIEFPEQAKEKFANSEFALQAHFVLDEKNFGHILRPTCIDVVTSFPSNFFCSPDIRVSPFFVCS